MKESRKENELLLIAKTSKRFYKISFDHEGTSVFVNNSRFGRIDAENNLRNTNNQILAQIQSHQDGSYDSIVNNGEVVAHFNFEGDFKSAESDRLFSMFHDFNMEENDEILLLTLFQLFFRNRIEH